MYKDSHNLPPRRLRVFFCYGHEDKPVVRDIYQKLKNYNIEPWIDEENLLPGENWEQIIPEVIRKCDIILICFSRTFLNKEGYGNYEMRIVLEAAKRRSPNTIYHIPFRLDDCEIPSYLNGIHYASHFIPGDFDKLIAACEKRGEWLNTMHGMNIEPIYKKSSELDPYALPKHISKQMASSLSNKDMRWPDLLSNPISAHDTFDQSIKVERFTMSKSLNPVNVFLSYAHEDELLLLQLEAHLSMLKREGLISTWCNRQIMPGSNWMKVIDQHLEQASLILLLVSADFLASDYCYQSEIKRALERHQAGDATVIPIVIRPTDWKKTTFAQLQALPTNARAITDWSNRDKAFVDVVSGIRKVLEDLASRTPDPTYGA